MSALHCCCDEAIGWLCEVHAKIQEGIRGLTGKRALLCGCDPETLEMCEEYRPKTGTVQQESFTQYKERLLNEILMRGSTAASFRSPQIAEPSPAEQPRAEAVLIESGQPSYGTTAYIAAPPLTLAEQFRVEAVRIAKQTPMPPNFKALTEGARQSSPSPAEQFRVAAVATAAAVETRDDLLNRIATMEAELQHERSRNAQRRRYSFYLLQTERSNHDLTKERIVRVAEREVRIAAVLARFYTEPLSLSSVQPLIALALELNPDLVERAR